MNHARIYVGTAGWTIPKPISESFRLEGTHLERYSGRFNAVELNSSFYRPHRPATYERWAATVPDEFRFAVKVPRRITHAADLERSVEALPAFLHECSHLGTKLGPLLFQFPPRRAFTEVTIRPFFETVRHSYPGTIVCEPRHPSWFTGEGDNLLAELRVATVAADPAVVPQAGTPGGHPDLCYYRLHGSPHLYTSAYSETYLQNLANIVTGHINTGVTVWCIFDNTAVGAATTDALTLLTLLGQNML